MKQQIDFKVRNKVRKAAKNGVMAREVTLMMLMFKEYTPSTTNPRFAKGSRFGTMGRTLRPSGRMNATFMDRSIFIGAFFEDNLIGFVKLVLDENRGQAG